MGKKERRYQSAVFALGVLLILVSVIEYSYGNFLSNYISNYENRIEQAELNRQYLIEITEKSSRVNMEYVALDFDCYASTTNGYFNTTEAIIRLMANSIHFSEPYQDLEEFFLFKLNDPVAEVDWIFSEKIITMQWLAEDFSTILPTFESKYNIDNFEEWSTVAYAQSADFFFFAASYSILKDWLGNMPFLIVVDFWKFDDYVESHFQQPLSKAGQQLSQLNAMVSLTMLGLLIIGYIVNFDDVSRFWKGFYLIIALGVIFVAVRASILIFLKGG